jgi:hypothetical protein
MALISITHATLAVNTQKREIFELLVRCWMDGNNPEEWTSYFALSFSIKPLVLVGSAGLEPATSCL